MTLWYLSWYADETCAMMSCIVNTDWQLWFRMTSEHNSQIHMNLANMCATFTMWFSRVKQNGFFGKLIIWNLGDMKVLILGLGQITRTHTSVHYCTTELSKITNKTPNEMTAITRRMMDGNSMRTLLLQLNQLEGLTLSRPVYMQHQEEMRARKTGYQIHINTMWFSPYLFLFLNSYGLLSFLQISTSF